MPTSKRSRPGSGDVWRRHASEIRKLYRNNTVENVKRFMEKERDFPEMAIPTWNEKLGKLGMRKNVTSEEWHKIYLHCVARLEDPTRAKGDLKLKRTKMETEIIVRGRQYSWDQAWKNMKSAKAIGQELKLGESLSPLPPDIVIRTPAATLSSSPIPIRSISLERASETAIAQEAGLVARRDVQTNQSLNVCSNNHMVAHVLFDHQGTKTIVSAEEYAEVVQKLCITDLPIYHVISYTAKIANLAAPSTTTAQDSPTLPGASSTSIRLPFEFEPRWNLSHQFLSASFACPSNCLSSFTSQKNYILLFMVIYVVSNNLVYESADAELLRNLDSVFAAVPSKYLEALLYRRLASIRAAFEALLDLAGRYSQRDAFQMLLKIGATYGWLSIPAKGHIFLFYAASMNLVSAVRTLLDSRCLPDLKTPGRAVQHRCLPAIVEALRCGNLQCAQLLLERYDVNKRVELWLPATNFELFIQKLHEIGKLSERGLALFLQTVADLDKPIKENMSGVSTRWDWSISVMDYLFYFHRLLFFEVSLDSARVQAGHLSRAGILISLEGGEQSLEEYLGNLTMPFDRERFCEFFQLLIAEQFLLCDMQGQKKDTDLATVRALESFGARFGAGINEVLRHDPEVLHSFALLVGDNYNSHQIEAALYLLKNGATVTGEVLSWMARLPDTRLLDLALGRMKHPQGLAIGVAHAAERNNFEAIEKLLRAGVRLDTDVPRRAGWGPRDRVSIVARVIVNHRQSGLSQMLDFLIRRGAPLRLSERKPHLHHLLQFTLDCCTWDWAQTAEIMERVQYIVDMGLSLRDSPFQTASLLENCHSPQVFEYLYRNGAQPRPGSPLAAWISRGGGIELCREMLEAGADPNAYTRYDRSPSEGRRRRRTPLQVAAWVCDVDVVELLLEAGSDVNAPARGYNGFTALQASCNDRIYSLQDQKRKLKTIRLLLAHGADVNAAPARNRGSTALQEAAASGDLAVAKLLLFRNPMADVNAPPCEYPFPDQLADATLEYMKPGFGTALDRAAEKGRIDMVKLLLNCNALSHFRGRTGYDGAIQKAKRRGHLAVADLINQHAEDAKRGYFKSPDLRKPPRNWREYGYESDSDADSVISEDEESSTWSTSSDIDEGHPSAAGHDQFGYNLSNSLDYNDYSMTTATNGKIWPSQEALELTEGESLMEMRHTQSSFLVDFDVSNDYEMSFDGVVNETL